MQAEVKHVVSTLSGNKYDVIIQTKAVGTSTWTTVLDPRYTPDATHTREYTPATVYDELKAFDTMITVKDDYSTATLLGVLPTTAYPLVLGDEGIGVGKVPVDGRALDVKGHTHIEGNLIITEGTTTQSMIATYSAPSNANELVDEWVLGKNGSNYPDATHYWYVNTIFYSGITSSRKQLAYGYNIDTMYSRYYYAATQTWSTWVKISN